MSWSFTAVGFGPAVAAKVRKEIGNPGYRCPEPEETIKKVVGALIESVAAGMPGDVPVEVIASGSQSDSGKGAITQSLTLTIKPMYGFSQ